VKINLSSFLKVPIDCISWTQIGREFHRWDPLLVILSVECTQDITYLELGKM